jgi:hypothetical protein
MENLNVKTFKISSQASNNEEGVVTENESFIDHTYSFKFANRKSKF